MARRKTTHKLNVTELEQDIAMAQVVGDTEREKVIREFCEMYVIPISKEHITEQGVIFGQLKQALDNEVKSKAKKS